MLTTSCSSFVVNTMAEDKSLLGKERNLVEPNWRNAKLYDRPKNQASTCRTFYKPTVAPSGGSERGLV